MYKLIILDYSMPVMDGPTACANIRAMLAEAQCDSKPFICCLTAYQNSTFKKNALSKGMDRFEVKPIFM